MPFGVSKDHRSEINGNNSPIGGVEWKLPEQFALYLFKLTEIDNSFK